MTDRDTDTEDTEDTDAGDGPATAIADGVMTRQHMSARQQATVQSLLDAAERVLRERGYDDLTLRLVASEADVTHTTAYTYFSSKAHLVAEVFWRRLRQIPHPEHDPRGSLPERVDAALREPGLALSDGTELAQGALAALLSSDPDAQRVRDRVGLDLAGRLGTAFGDEVDPGVADTLLLAFSGAMLQAGMGYFEFDGVVSRVSTAAELVGGPLRTPAAR